MSTYGIYNRTKLIALVEGSDPKDALAGCNRVAVRRWTSSEHEFDTDTTYDVLVRYEGASHN
jgi:hypothetical protein